MIDISDVRQLVKMDPAQEPVFQGWVDTAIAMWESATRRLWNYRAGYVQTFTLLELLERRRRRLWLDLAPLSAVTASEWCLANGPTTALAIAATDYAFDANTREVIRVRCSPWAEVTQFTMTGGYTVDTCPAHIKRALVIQTAYMSARTTGPALIANSQAFEKGSTSYMTADLHPLFRELADQLASNVVGCS